MDRTAVLYIDDSMCDDDLRFSGKYLPDEIPQRLSGIIGKTLFSVSAHYTGLLSDRAETRVRTGDDISNWKALATEPGSLIKIYADSPFIDASIITEMVDVHEKYLAEYTYSENLPGGLSCEIFSGEFISSLPSSDEKRIPLSQVIRSNINQFDVELYYKGPDIRDKRLSFRSSDVREKRIMEDLFRRTGSFPSYESLRSLIEKNCDALYIGPSYIELELTGKAELETIYSYRKALTQKRGDMDLSTVKKIISDMRQFSLPYTVSLGGSGDPMLHASFFEVLGLFRDEPLVKTIIIETDGTKMNASFAEYLSKANDNRILIIVEMNGYNSDTYRAIHGTDMFTEVERNILQTRDAMGDLAKNLYIQLMKINETESFIDPFYDYWENHKVPIILQKQNTCLGTVEDRRYYDLTPLDRVPCWHLQRDLFILSDGKVGFCKQDINGNFSEWNASKESISDIWNKRKNIFLNDYSGTRETSPNCSICDEWYTFNM